MAKSSPQYLANSPIPVSTGIGLKPQHFEGILETPPKLGWFEVHTENYMGRGGALHYYLEKIRRDYPLSLHGVGLSLGASGGLDGEHLARVKQVIERYEPGLVSEHVSFSTVGDTYLNDLLPLPYTEESLGVITRNVNHMQDVLGRQILVENPSTYLQFTSSHISEPEFLNEIVNATGCGLLLDINNIYVSASNHGWDAQDYISQIDGAHVQEFHLAGHAERVWREKVIRIDDHGSNVTGAVWDLFSQALELIGPRPTLIEWDSNVPSLLTLLQEAGRAENYLAEALDEVA